MVYVLTILGFRFSAPSSLKYMRDGGGGRSAEGEGEGDAGILYLVGSGFSAQLLNGFHSLVNAFGSDRVAAAFAPAHGQDWQPAIQFKQPITSHLPGFSLFREAAGFQA